MYIHFYFKQATQFIVTDVNVSKQLKQTPTVHKMNLCKSDTQLVHDIYVRTIHSMLGVPHITSLYHFTTKFLGKCKQYY